MFVKIYGTPSCTYCNLAKKMCDANDIEYAYLDISSNHEAMEEIKTLSGGPVKSVPQIVIDGVYLPGGFQSLREKI